MNSNLPLHERCKDLPYNNNYEWSRDHIKFTHIIHAGKFNRIWEAVSDKINDTTPKDRQKTSSNLPSFYDISKLSISQRYHRRPRASNFELENRNKVTVKCLNENADEEDYQLLALELKMMMFIGCHENIVNLLGACTVGGPLWLIRDHCSQGDLLKFLHIRRDNFFPSWTRMENATPGFICFSDLLAMAQGVCEGMKFLSSKGEYDFHILVIYVL